MYFLSFPFGNLGINVSTNDPQIIFKDLTAFSNTPCCEKTIEITILFADCLKLFNCDTQGKWSCYLSSLKTRESVSSFYFDVINNFKIKNLDFPPLFELSTTFFKAIYPNLNKCIFIIYPSLFIKTYSLSFKFIFQSAMPYLLPQFDYFYLHASGFSVDNHGGIFIGRNKAGKSTATKLLCNAYIYNDDHIICRRDNGLFSLIDCDYKQHIYSYKSCGVRAIFHLLKGELFEISRIDAKSSLRKSWVDQYSMFWNQKIINNNKGKIGKEVVSKHFRLLSSLLYSVPNYRMTFPKDYIDQDQIEAVLKGEHPECFKDPAPELFIEPDLHDFPSSGTD